MWFIYTMEYYAAEKNNDIMKFAGKWMELENVILSEQWSTQINIPPISEANHKLKYASKNNIKRYYQEKSLPVQVVHSREQQLLIFERLNVVELPVKSDQNFHLTPTDFTSMAVETIRYTVFPKINVAITPMVITPLVITPMAITPMTITPMDITPMDITPMDITPMDITPMDITPMDIVCILGQRLQFIALSLTQAFGINSILYQRGIYPSETFTRVQKYGLTLLVTTDPELIKYLNNVVEQLK
ncbi:hypothetical protein STEG23_027909, partial [Scotinomys teguina]